MLGGTADNPLGIRLVGPVAGFSALVGFLAFRGYPACPQPDRRDGGTSAQGMAGFSMQVGRALDPYVDSALGCRPAHAGALAKASPAALRGPGRAESDPYGPSGTAVGPGEPTAWRSLDGWRARRSEDYVQAVAVLREWPGKSFTSSMSASASRAQRNRDEEVVVTAGAAPRKAVLEHAQDAGLAVWAGIAVVEGAAAGQGQCGGGQLPAAVLEELAHGCPCPLLSARLGVDVHQAVAVGVDAGREEGEVGSFWPQT